MQSGPDPRFREPGGEEAARFCAAPAEGPYEQGRPIDYARGKARLFPDEGGGVLLWFEVPDELAPSFIAPLGMLIAGMAMNMQSEVIFELSGGLEDLLEIWPDLKKWIELLEPSE